MSKLAALTRRRAVTLAVGAIAVAAPAAALAAHPVASAHYRGTGTDCYNDTAGGGYTACAGKTKMSFRVSSSGVYIRHFVGHYTYYCGGGETYVTDGKITVAPDGSFHSSGKYPSYGPNDKRNGTIHAFIRGRFIDHGHKADVTFRVADYFFATPHARPCGTLVKGVATAQ